MARKRKFPKPLPQYKAERMDESEEAQFLRAHLLAALARYAERLGPAEVARRTAADILDESGRVEWRGGKPSRAAREAMAEAVLSRRD